MANLNKGFSSLTSFFGCRGVLMEIGQHTISCRHVEHPAPHQVEEREQHGWLLIVLTFSGQRKILSKKVDFLLVPFAGLVVIIERIRFNG